MPRRRSVTACVREMKALNARFRRLKNKDGPMADRLRERKDALIDEMAAVCAHPKVVATPGADAHGPLQRRVAGRRICPRCGHCELDGAKDAQLTGRPSTVLPVADYVIEQGRIVKRLGIDL